jgi:hypothetical protein
MTDNSKPAWAKALDIETQRILDTVKTEELTIKTEQNEYVNVTLTQYGQLGWDTPLLRDIANNIKFESWVEEDKKRKAYWATPEGKAELERDRIEREARWERETKFAKRWQWLHNKLVSKGCRCDHDDCGGW